MEIFKAILLTVCLLLTYQTLADFIVNIINKTNAKAKHGWVAMATCILWGVIYYLN